MSARKPYVTVAVTHGSHRAEVVVHPQGFATVHVDGNAEAVFRGSKGSCVGRVYALRQIWRDEEAKAKLASALAEREERRRRAEAEALLTPLKRASKNRVARIEHALIRAQQRYGLTLSEEDLQALEAAVYVGESRPLTGGRHVVTVDGRQAVVALRDGEIVTFLPPSMLPAHGRRGQMGSTAAPG